jgi:hypothetical protein
LGTKQPRLPAPGNQWKRWSGWLALALIWAAFTFIWIVPLFQPRGEFGWGHYRTRDIYLGMPVALGTLGATLIAIARTSSRRRSAVRLMMALTASLVFLIGLDVAYSLGLLGLPLPYFWYGNTPIPRQHNLPDRELGWVRKPRLHERRPDPTGTRLLLYRTDEHGFRNPPGGSRADIVFIGDSYTEGSVVSEEETFISRVGATSGLRVANLGRARYCLQQELLVLRKYGLGYRPRVVVWEVFEYKDLYSAEAFDAWRRSGGRQPQPSRMEQYVAGSVINSLLTRTARPSGSCKLKLTGGGAEPYLLHFAYRADGPERYPLGFSETKRSLDSGYSLCRSRGIQLLVLFMPTPVRFLEKHLDFQDPRDREQLLPGGATSDPRDFGSQFALYCRRRQIPFIDLEPVLRARAAVDNRHLIFPTDEHLGTGGNEAVAEAVLQWLQSRGLMDRRGRYGA